jgi:hypothetical protein
MGPLMFRVAKIEKSVVIGNRFDFTQNLQGIVKTVKYFIQI